MLCIMPAQKGMDAVIVGAGIIGSACALFLARAGARVTVLERRFPASGTSGACDGIVLLWDKAPGPELELGKLSVQLWKELAEILGPSMEFQQRGTIMLAESDDDLELAGAHAARMRSCGVSVEPLSDKELRDAEPALAEDLPGGFLFPGDAQVEPRKATWAMLREARRLGAEIRLDAEVLGLAIEASGRTVGVWTKGGLVGGDAVVLAAGVFTPSLLPDPRVVPVLPRKGHILVVGRGVPEVGHCLLEGGYVGTVQSAGDLQVATVLEPTLSGTLLVGSSRQFAGYDRTAEPAVIVAVAKRALRFLPGLTGAKVLRTYAGLRPFSPDHLPIIGKVPGHEGLLVATGHEGAGISLAPGTGWLIAGMVAGRELPAFVSAFDPARFQG